MPTASASHSRAQLAQDLVEHRLRVGDRAADHLQDLAGRRLLLERLLRLVEQPHVLDRDHRLVGEGLQQLDLLLAERPADSRGRRMIAPIAAPSRSIGTIARRSPLAGSSPARGAQRSWIGVGRARRVRAASAAPASRRRACTRASSGIGKRCAIRSLPASRRATARRCRSSSSSAKRDADRRVATDRAPLCRIASNTGCTSVGELLMTSQDLRGRGLLLQRLPGLVEQAHVLDRDHRLVGEGLEQRDLLLAERPGLPARRRSRRRRGLRAASARRASRRQTACGGACSARDRDRSARRREFDSHAARIAGRESSSRRAASGYACFRLCRCSANPCAAPAVQLVAVVADDAATWRRTGAARCDDPSNTGWVSVAELLMTCSISAVAVCCSSASFVSLNRRTFSIAITAWSAKVLQQLGLALRRLARVGQATTMAPTGLVLDHWRADHAPPLADRGGGGVVAGVVGSRR